MTNRAGAGLIAAIDLASAALRDEVLTALRADERVLALACGDRSIRFRPALSISAAEVDAGVDALARVLGRLGAAA